MKAGTNTGRPHTSASIGWCRAGTVDSHSKAITHHAHAARSSSSKWRGSALHRHASSSNSATPEA